MLFIGELRRDLYRFCVNVPNLCSKTSDIILDFYLKIKNNVRICIKTEPTNSEQYSLFYLILDVNNNMYIQKESEECLIRCSKEEPNKDSKDSCKLAILRTPSRRSRKVVSAAKINLLKLEEERLHNRFGHISPSYLYRLKTIATGPNEFILNKTSANCSICAKSKKTQKFTKEPLNHAKLFTLI